jgi:hypothetical protein
MAATRSHVNIQQKLAAALLHAKASCAIGAHNKLEDLQRTSLWSLLNTNLYRPGAYIKINNQWHLPPRTTTPKELNTLNLLYRTPGLNPLEDPNFNLSYEQHLLLRYALYTQTLKTGNCENLSTLVVKFLWENPTGIERIELVQTSSYDHGFVIVNRKGELDQPASWGDCWIVDAATESAGLIYPGSEFEQMDFRIKNFWLNSMPA